MSYRGDTFDPKSVKYWLTPEIDWLIKKGDITYYPHTMPVQITPTMVTLQSTDDGSAAIDVDADFVLALDGYQMDTTLLEQTGVELVGANNAPKLDPLTMQTNVPGLYVIGTAAAGTQYRFKLFIENCHPHVVRAMRALCGCDPKHINPLGFERLDESADTIDRMLET